MTIAPIVTGVRVKVAPDRAFELFTANISNWWQARGRCLIGATQWVEIVIEPRQGGRMFERDADGNETGWGTVLAWEPPRRLLIGWHLTSAWAFDPAFVTEVEVTFTAAPAGGTDVRLEHRNLERFGAAAQATAASLGGGWPTHIIKGFGAFADSDAEAGR